MAGEPVVTIVGNLTRDPELRFTSSGVAVADFSVAMTPRSFDRSANDTPRVDTRASQALARKVVPAATRVATRKAVASRVDMVSNKAATMRPPEGPLPIRGAPRERPLSVKSRLSKFNWRGRR